MHSEPKVDIRNITSAGFFARVLPHLFLVKNSLHTLLVVRKCDIFGWTICIIRHTGTVVVYPQKVRAVFFLFPFYRLW